MSTPSTPEEKKDTGVTRRGFVKTGAALGAVAAASSIPMISRTAYAQGDGRTYGLGIVGSGGRGTGAIFNHLQAAQELGIDVELRAMGDVAEDRLNGSLANLQQNWGAKIQVDQNSRFTGFDAYKGVCAHEDVDIVIQTTPPGLRYLTLAEAVKNGKHSFVEKPVCVDADTYRSVLASGGIAENNNLAIVSGTQYRRENSYADAINQLQQGLIGEITASYAYYCAGTLWHRGRGPAGAPWNQMEYQMRNWLYFAWLSGDLIAEQSVHNIDAINWAMGGPPARCYASGGRIARTSPDYGNVYDHFSVQYDYANGSRCTFMGRQYPGCDNRVENRFVGTNGVLDIQPNPGRTRWIARDHDGNELGRNAGRDGNNEPYVEEHKALLQSIEDGNPIQEIQEVADSSLTAVIGRESAYSGKYVDFNWMANTSQLKLRPDVPPFVAGDVDQTVEVEVDGQVKRYDYSQIPIPGTYELR
ncbi:MAG: Gfo/Idh/MocA family oxidoreductase [Planctomycetota bacterium]